mmetsp:Transcript_89387/g.289080  ORF Transcript_89387/g.289080 Transcript_89387/m.289080 type:complete len:202 (+) Transcript_89387:1038-1643(+)
MFLTRFETIPGIWEPPATPPCAVPPSSCRPAAGCGRTECMNLNMAQKRCCVPSVPSSASSDGSKNGWSSTLGSSFLSTDRRGMMTSPMQSTTRVEITSCSGCSARALGRLSPGAPPRSASAAAAAVGSRVACGDSWCLLGVSASESSASKASILKSGRPLTCDPFEGSRVSAFASPPATSFPAAASKASRSSVKRPLPTSL